MSHRTENDYARVVAVDELPPLFAPGQHLGRYELLRRLAVGGMAEVYLAYAVGPGDFRKVVAIKRLLPQHTLDPQLLRMFLDEARLMARLSHPSIPQVTDVDDGATGEVPYFVMEYVHGTDLRGVLNAAAGPLPIEHAVAITCAVAAGLHHAHEHRGSNGQPLEIVHRDVSPSNILISFDGAVKVTDFGVAKWTEQKSFTHQGQLKGKFAHMSPEQCRGEPLDRRSDVFALGTLLYEMTTGEPPFVADSEYELLTQIISRDAAPPRRPGEDYPVELAAIVGRSLGRARDARYASTQQLQLDLEAFARAHRLMVSPVALAAYLESLFGARVTEWREALASGRTLADHLDRPAGKTAAEAADRTATDAFALRPARRAAPDVLSASTDGAPGPRAERARPKAGVARTLTIIGGATLALVLLLVATEMTSRWQQTARPILPPVRTTDSAPALPASSSSRVSPTAPVPTGSPTLPTGQPPAASARGGDSLVVDSSGREAPANHRGRDSANGSAAAGRRNGTTAGTAATAPAAPPVGELQEDGVREPAPEQTPPPAAAAPSPSPPVKVWDPDSPVPP